MITRKRSPNLGAPLSRDHFWGRFWPPPFFLKKLPGCAAALANWSLGGPNAFAGASATLSLQPFLCEAASGLPGLPGSTGVGAGCGVGAGGGRRGCFLGPLGWGLGGASLHPPSMVLLGLAAGGPARPRGWHYLLTQQCRRRQHARATGKGCRQAPNEKEGCGVPGSGGDDPWCPRRRAARVETVARGLGGAHACVEARFCLRDRPFWGSIFGASLGTKNGPFLRAIFGAFLGTKNRPFLRVILGDLFGASGPPFFVASGAGFGPNSGTNGEPIFWPPKWWPYVGLPYKLIKRKVLATNLVAKKWPPKVGAIFLKMVAAERYFWVAFWAAFGVPF